jgi:hypothetical protein
MTAYQQKITFGEMREFIEPRQPSKADRPPSGPDGSTKLSTTAIG